MDRASRHGRLSDAYPATGVEEVPRRNFSVSLPRCTLDSVLQPHNADASVSEVRHQIRKALTTA